MKRLNAIVIGMIALGLAGSARADDKTDDYAKKIVGKWELTKAGGDVPVGSIVEFTKDGKLSATIKADGMEIKLEGTYKLDKDKLALTIKVNDQTVEETVTIKKLTDEVMELEDKDKKVDELKKKK